MNYVRCHYSQVIIFLTVYCCFWRYYIKLRLEQAQILHKIILAVLLNMLYKETS